ncbi:MAG: hypothetical protein IPQ13_14205 [Holophagaceae bacterium]|nr:hypothetical protein [Holophagaceae bacterium]
MHPTTKNLKSLPSTRSKRFATRTGSILTGLGLALLAALPATAQSGYRVVDLTPSGYGVANAASGGSAAGLVSTTPGAYTGHAAMWAPGGLVDLHPDLLLDDPAAGLFGRSVINGLAGGLQVGWGTGKATGNRAAAMAWHDSAASAAVLGLPFAAYASQALKTDGFQIVGSANPFIKDGTTFGPPHAIVWDAITGAAVDLGDGGNGAQALGVGGGQQVGYVIRGTFNAALWTGSDRSLLVIHPKNAAASQANATDGVRQVGWAGYDVRVRSEAAKGNHDARFNYATMWTGTVESATTIHPYPINNPTNSFSHSYATAVNGQTIVGYAGDQTAVGTPAYNHAIVWDASLNSIDLNAFLPTGFVGSQAFSVDAQGNIAGVMSTANGERHAVLWIPIF